MDFQEISKQDDIRVNKVPIHHARTSAYIYIYVYVIIYLFLFFLITIVIII